MADINNAIFIRLFKEACEKCFGHAIDVPLSETDSRLLSNEILDRTGLVIGVKSIRNYSLYVYKPDEGKNENPSAASLDTLARYVMNAPPTDEIRRKQQESHHPYWFGYRRRYIQSQPVGKRPAFIKAPKPAVVFISLFIVAAAVILIIQFSKTTTNNFTENFNVLDDSLTIAGWNVVNIDTGYWQKHGEKKGYITLYTLTGDNWPGPTGDAKIRNLMMRKFDADCFVTEIHLYKFFPNQNWQQAGILLSEDPSFNEKVVRLSISYNDFFGGYEKQPEIIIQAVSSTESGKLIRPEEIVHMPLFVLEKGKEELARKNLEKASLRIEKKGQLYRFLYTTGSSESFAFNVAAEKKLSIQPRYVAIFAMKGLSDTEGAMPVYIDSFLMNGIPCSE